MEWLLQRNETDVNQAQKKERQATFNSYSQLIFCKYWLTQFLLHLAKLLYIMQWEMPKLWQCYSRGKIWRFEILTLFHCFLNDQNQEVCCYRWTPCLSAISQLWMMQQIRWPKDDFFSTEHRNLSKLLPDATLQIQDVSLNMGIETTFPFLHMLKVTLL